MADNIFDKIDEGTKTFADRTKSFVIRYFPYILLIGNIVFEILARLFEVGFTVPFTPRFWSTLFINTVTSTLTYACFVFYAEKKHKEEKVSYTEDARIWSTMSQRVRTDFFEEFLAYCKRQYDRECEERRIALIVNNTRITVVQWQERYRAMTDKEIRLCAKRGEILPEDAKYIIKANKHPKLRQIDPLLILSGMRVGDINDAGRSNSSSVKAVLFRPIPVLVVSIAASMFAGTFIGVSDTSVLFDMLYTAAMVCTAAIFGYSKGIASADQKHNEIRSRIIFLQRFEKELTI